MALLGLLFIPIFIAVVGFFLGQGKITGKEFAVQFGVTVVLISMGYLIGRCEQTADVEIWNGRIAEKHQGSEHCCHAYPCHPHSCMCGKNGCSTCWDICYAHSHDLYWSASSTNHETVFSDGCNSPGSSPPKRWLDIRVGEPTAAPHDYTNYIKGAPDSILRRQGIAEKYKSLIPEYPRVYDYYRANRFLVVGVKGVNSAAETRWRNELDEINADLGPSKWVHVIVILVPTADRTYLHALEEAWLGGKKNDFVVVVGVPDYPKISWAGAMSWTKSEELKISVRDQIENLRTFDGDKVISLTRGEIQGKYVFRPMDDFEYLSASVTPSKGVMIFLFILGICVSAALQIYFWREDPFGDRYF